MNKKAQSERKKIKSENLKKKFSIKQFEEFHFAWTPLLLLKGLIKCSMNGEIATTKQQ